MAAGGGRPAEPPRGPMPRVCGGRRGPRNAREGRGPSCTAARGTPAGADAPRVRRPAGGLRNACKDRCPARGGGLREACGMPAGGPRPRVYGGPHGSRNACEDRCPACTAACGVPAERPRGLRPRVYGGLRSACGTPAGADAPRGRRPAWVAERLRGPMPRVYGGLRSACRTPAGDRCPRRTTQGGRIQRPPKRLSSPLPGACRAAGPPGLRPAGAVRPRIRRHAR